MQKHGELQILVLVDNCNYDRFNWVRILATGPNPLDERLNLNFIILN